MNDLIEALQPYAGDSDLPEELKRDIKYQIEQKFNEVDTMSDDYDKYQAALNHISKLGIHVPKGKHPSGSGAESDQYFSTVDDLISSLT
jgi:hypothetical protein